MFGIDECHGFLVHAAFLITEDIQQFFEKRNIIILARLNRPYMDLLSWKIGYQFNRIPVDQPEKSELKLFHDRIK